MQSPRLIAIAAAAAFLGATAAAAGRCSSDAGRWTDGALSRLAQEERPKV
jgi:hypothetical protein